MIHDYKDEFVDDWGAIVSTSMQDKGETEVVSGQTQHKITSD